MEVKLRIVCCNSCCDLRRDDGLSGMTRWWCSGWHCSTSEQGGHGLDLQEGPGPGDFVFSGLHGSVWGFSGFLGSPQKTQLTENLRLWTVFCPSWGRLKHSRVPEKQW